MTFAISYKRQRYMSQTFSICQLCDTRWHNCMIGFPDVNFGHEKEIQKKGLDKRKNNMEKKTSLREYKVKEKK